MTNFSDINESQLAQKWLAASRDQGLVALDAGCHVLFASKSAQRLLHVDPLPVGESLTQWLRQQWRGAHKPDISMTQLEEFLHQKVASSKNIELTFSLKSTNHKTWLSWQIVPLVGSEFPSGSILLHLKDISLHKQQEEQLTHQISEMSDQNRQWQSIYNGVQESIVLLDVKGKILTLNPATEIITGHKANEVIGRHVGELFPKVGVLGSGIDYKGRSGLYQTLEEGRPSDLFEAVVETKDKRHIWINYTYTPLRDTKGKITGLVRVTSDVSTVKAVEQMKNDFVSIASHELRTPLGVINGYLNLFLNGQLGELTSDQHTFLERLYHSSTDMVVLVEDLLNVSRIEAGRIEVNVTSFDLRTLVDEIVDHLEPRHQAKQQKVKISRPKNPVLVSADEQKVGQALTNIIDNAIKYTYDNGVITISIKPESTVAEVSIKDSGVGIKPENLGHIFEKFYRESNPLSIREGGSGLGLYISRKLIELHGGSITVKSTMGEGSTFKVSLPLSAKKS